MGLFKFSCHWTSNGVLFHFYMHIKVVLVCIFLVTITQLIMKLLIIDSWKTRLTKRTSMTISAEEGHSKPHSAQRQPKTDSSACSRTWKMKSYLFSFSLSSPPSTSPSSSSLSRTLPHHALLNGTWPRIPIQILLTSKLWEFKFSITSASFTWLDTWLAKASNWKENFEFNLTSTIFRWTLITFWLSMIYLLEDLCTVRPLTVQGKSLTLVIILSLQAFHLVTDDLNLIWSLFHL